MKKHLTGILLFLFSICVKGQISEPALKEWENRKYSMFIHWGIYSELGGIWDGKQISRGLSEQIQAHAGIYSDTYANVAKKFNPEKWNADSIVLLAKNAGMRSIVFTSKHHDGFCMYKSAHTDFNVVDATPFKRDVLKELSEACSRHGIKLGLYFSLIDWHYPQAYPISSHNSDLITPEHFEYNKKQIQELLSNYGPISELWFDMGSHSFEQSAEMKKWVHSIQPDCMIGSRLGNDMNDFVVMGDNHEPDYVIGVPWQSPASFFHETWGYRSWQERGSEDAKMKEKLGSLIRVVSHGGNYLLNIGPRGDGSVVEFEKNVLLRIGKWLEKNGEAIYGTNATPYHIPFQWGTISSRPDKLYLFITNKPENGTIFLPELNGIVKKVYVLGENMSCNYHYNKKGLSIDFNLDKSPETDVKVLVVEFEGDYSVPPVNSLSFSKNLKLDQHNAFKYYSNSGIDYNTIYQSVIKEEWNLSAPKNEQTTPILYYTEQEKGRSIRLKLGDREENIVLDGSKSIHLKNNIKKLALSPIYILGPLNRTGIEGANGDVKNIDLSKPCAGKEWTKTDWENDKIYWLDGGMRQAYYMLQEIESPVDQLIIVSITSPEAVILWLNGQQLLKHNNPYKKQQMEDIVLLNLKKGKNQVLVKCFSNFLKKAPMGISIDKPQQIYAKTLPPIKMEKDKRFSVSWQFANPITPHETLNLPNLSLKFK